MKAKVISRTTEQSNEITELKTKLSNESDLKEKSAEELSKEKEINKKNTLEINQLNNEITKLETKLSSESDSKKNSLLEFRELSNQIYNEKNEQSKNHIKEILGPLKIDISEFKTKVENTYDKESKERFSLEDKIKDLTQVHQQLRQ